MNFADSVKCLSACEWKRSSWRALLRGPMKPLHVFQDIQYFISDSIKTGVCEAANRPSTTAALLRQVLTQQGGVGRHGQCVVCSKLCMYRSATIHVAGTPCVDWSGMPGAKRQGEVGSAAVPFFVWVAMRLLIQEAIIIHENVPKFDVRILQYLLGDMYMIMSVILNLVLFGFPVRRKRRVTVLIHKSKLRQPTVIWDDIFVRPFIRDIGAIVWRMFLLAEEGDLETEFNWASRRKLLVKTIPEFANCADVAGHRFVEVLVAGELKFLREYRRRSPRCSYMLGQNPRVLSAKSTETTAMCQIRNQGTIFSDLDDRWFAARELLAMQGFPVFQTTKLHHEETAFDGPPMVHECSSMIEQAGNSMPIPLIAVPLLWALMCTSAGEPVPLLRKVLRATLSSTSSEAQEDDDECIGNKRRRVRVIV